MKEARSIGYLVNIRAVTSRESDTPPGGEPLGIPGGVGSRHSQKALRSKDIVLFVLRQLYGAKTSQRHIQMLLVFLTLRSDDLLQLPSKTLRGTCSWLRNGGCRSRAAHAMSLAVSSGRPRALSELARAIFRRFVASATPTSSRARARDWPPQVLRGTG